MDWKTSLGLQPDPVVALQPDQALHEQVQEVTRQADDSKMHFTPRDWDTLGVIKEHPIPDGDPRYCEVSNSKLAKILGMTAGAAAARVSRLIKMGIVKPWYSVAVETGKVNRRVLELMQDPPAPWSPD